MWHLLPNLHEIDFLIQKKSGSALHIFALIVIFGARDSSNQGMLNVDRYESNSPHIQGEAYVFGRFWEDVLRSLDEMK